MKRIIYWFRNDLRLHDQPVLHQLSTKNDVLLAPVFVFDERWFEQTSLGFPKSGSYRMEFLISTVEKLRDALRNVGSDLIIIKGLTEVVLSDLAKNFGAEALYAAKEDTPEETSIEQALVARLEIPIFYHESKTLIRPDRLPFEIDELPDVFTRFRKLVEPVLGLVELLPAPAKLPPFPSALISKKSFVLDDFGLPEAQSDPRSVLPFEGGEEEGLERLNMYIWKKQFITTYKETRNGMIGADYSSKFSPWLANGSLSPRMIYHEIKKFEKQVTANDSTYWLVFELLWRDYFRFVAKKFGSRIFHQNGISNRSVRYHNNPQLFEKWRTGNTGNDFVDANMRELLHTGFMSNRGRQNVASFLCKDLKIDWRWGASWFESQLIDYDVASNWGNWMYVAGVGNDPRQDRYFNTGRQAAMYDPDRKYRKLWLEK